MYKKRLFNNGNAIATTTLYDNMGYLIQNLRLYILGTTPVYSTLTRDQLHRIIQIQDTAGFITTRSYAGMQVTETDPRGIVTATTLNTWEKIVT